MMLYHSTKLSCFFCFCFVFVFKGEGAENVHVVSLCPTEKALIFNPLLPLFMNAFHAL